MYNYIFLSARPRKITIQVCLNVPDQKHPAGIVALTANPPYLSCSMAIRNTQNSSNVARFILMQHDFPPAIFVSNTTCIPTQDCCAALSWNDC